MVYETDQLVRNKFNCEAVPVIVQRASIPSFYDSVGCDANNASRS